ncbi:protein abrupt isoform X1 [Hyalella azteca]|uniref:Protein abrupt isoform X1 n=1 Tax=Hyalella azteca TaxID=294128 RepID=A0A8B7N062_HYAAZ|nr:protein abrupt isoform X1 [Hyalella azteca]
MSNSSASESGGNVPNSLNPSILSLAGFMGANMRTNMSGMAGLNHMRVNMPSPINQSNASMSMNSTSSNHVTNAGGWMGGSGGVGGGGGNNEGNGGSIVGNPQAANLMWGDMADSLMERGRSKNWTYEETMELINTYTSDEWQNKFCSEKKNHRAIWAEMAEVLKKREGVTGDEARQRLNNLKALYNRIRRQLIAGEIANPQWEYWDSLHNFLTRQSQYHHPFFGFPRSSPPVRSSHTPSMHPTHTAPSGYPHVHPMQFPRPHHNRMTHMMPPHHMTIHRSHEMNSSGPPCTPFKIKSEMPGYDDVSPSNTGGPDYRTDSSSSKSPGRSVRTFNFEESAHNDDGVVGQRSMLQDDNGELSSGGGSVGLSGIEAVVAAAAAAAAAAGDPGPAVSGASQTSTDNHMMMGGGAMTSSISSSAAAREAAIGMSPPSVTSPNKPESYQLRHNNHLSLVLNQLAEDEAFMDVTLTAEGRSVKAHKSVLSAVSPYFSAVLRANPCQHPIIIMPRDVRYAELSNIIMYIYKGEMTVSAEDLPSLLKTAELLRITGLSPGENATSSQQPLTRTTNLSSSSSTVTANSFAGLFNGSMNPTSTSYSTPPHSESSRVLGSPRHEHLLQTTPIKKSSGSCLAKATPVRIESPTPDPTMLNPSDFMDLDMTCVKEELNSEEEDEEDIPKSPSPKEVTTPPPVENPLSSDSRDRHPPDARLDQEDPDTQPNLEAASDDHDSSHLRQSSHQSSSSPAGQREDSDNEIKRSSLKTLANLASLDTPTNLSPCDDSSSSSSSSLPDTSEILPNVCPYCSEYVVGNDMSSHLSTKHAFKPAFICSECQRVFTRKNVREMHAKDCKKET